MVPPVARNLTRGSSFSAQVLMPTPAPSTRAVKMRAKTGGLRERRSMRGGAAATIAQCARLRGVELVLMGAAEPVGQVRRGCVRRRTVEGHHGRGHSWKLQYVRPPPLFVDHGHLDQIATAVDDSLKTMPHEVRYVLEKWEVEQHELYALPGFDQAKRSTNVPQFRDASGFTRNLNENKFCCRWLNRLFTSHPQVFHTAFALRASVGLTRTYWHTTLKPLAMTIRDKRVALAALLLAAGVQLGAIENVTLFRVILNDGTAVVSYGEFARVGDRVVFSMPIGAVSAVSSTAANLHVVNIPAAAVDWAATSKYA